MLARLSAATRILQEWELEYGSTSVAISKEHEEGTLLVDFLAVSLPRPDQTFQRVVERCSNTVRGIQSTISEHLDSVAETLYQLEENSGNGDLKENNDTTLEECNLTLLDSLHETSTCIPMSPLEQPTTCSNFCIPIIIVTTCEGDIPSVPSRVPLQNAAFGKQLTVPGYPAHNMFFPPQIAPPAVRSGITGWIWREGHWEAELFSLEEQERRRLYSKMTPKRKIGRSLRAVHARNPQHL